jgi:MFS family permease
MFLGMTLWFSATAANAQIVDEFQLSAAQTAWLTMAVQGGFVVGTLLSAVLNLPDVLSPRRLFNVGCIIGALANASLAVAGTATTIIVLRLVTGAALAWVYPPGMKVASGWFERDRRRPGRLDRRAHRRLAFPICSPRCRRQFRGAS